MSERKLKLALRAYGVGGPGQINLWKDPRIPKNASIDIDWYIAPGSKGRRARPVRRVVHRGQPVHQFQLSRLTISTGWSR